MEVSYFYFLNSDLCMLQTEMVINLQDSLLCERFHVNPHIFGMMGGLVKSPPSIYGSHFLD